MNDDRSAAEIKALFAQETSEVAEETPAETADTVTTDDRARDEQGRFVAQETPDETQLLAGKYKTPEDLEKAYKSLEQKLGEQGAQLSEYRSLEEQFSQLREELAPAPSVTDDVVSWFDEQAERNPQGAAMWALQNNPLLYQRALDTWMDTDRVGAMDFHSRKVAAETAQQLRAELAPELGTVKAQATQAEFAQAFKGLEGKYEDFAQVMGTVDEASISGFPEEVLTVLQSGDVASKQRVLETLYRWQKAEQAGNLSQAAEQQVRQAEQETRQARQQATVASASTSPSRESGNTVDIWRDSFRDSPEFRKAAGLIP